MNASTVSWLSAVTGGMVLLGTTAYFLRPARIAQEIGLLVARGEPAEKIVPSWEITDFPLENKSEMVDKDRSGPAWCRNCEGPGLA